jgi:hypothetical protein
MQFANSDEKPRKCHRRQDRDGLRQTTKRNHKEGFKLLTKRMSSHLLLAFVSAPQLLLDSGVGGAGVDEGQARVHRFVVIAPCPRRHPQPDAVLLESWLNCGRCTSGVPPSPGLVALSLLVVDVSRNIDVSRSQISVRVVSAVPVFPISLFVYPFLRVYLCFASVVVGSVN